MRLHQPVATASRTCELAGFGAVARVDDELVEWSYGAYDGKTISEIRDQRPGWDSFETAVQAANRSRT